MEFGRAQLLTEDLRSVCNERRDELDGLVVLQMAVQGGACMGQISFWDGKQKELNYVLQT